MYYYNDNQKKSYKVQKTNILYDFVELTKSIRKMINLQLLRDKIKDSNINLLRYLESNYHLNFNLKGKCLSPFQAEKTPSFQVWDNNSFKCFSSGLQGDVIKFVMEMDNLSFSNTLIKIAENEGIDIPHYSTEAEKKYKKEKVEKEARFEALKFAKTYFYEKLLSDEGKDARKYLEDRGYTEEDWKNYGIGFCPEGWDFQNILLEKFGKNKKILLETNLLTKKEKDEKITYYTLLFGRITFCLFDELGNPIGFSGRVLKDKKKDNKYINPSSSSKTYNKSKFLYGLHLAKKAIKETRTVNFCEGYTDFISLHKSGVENTVSISGTAFTKDQLELLVRNGAGKFNFILDADKAGTKATATAINLLISKGYIPTVTILPPEKDPHDICKTSDFSNILQNFITPNKTDFISFLAEKYLKIQDAEETQEKIEAFETIRKTVERYKFEEGRELIWKDLHEKFGITPKQATFQLFMKDGFERNDLQFFNKIGTTQEVAEFYHTKAIAQATPIYHNGRHHVGHDSQGSPSVLLFTAGQESRLLLSKFEKGRYQFVEQSEESNIHSIFGYDQCQGHSKNLILVSNPEDLLCLRTLLNESKFKNWDVIEYNPLNTIHFNTATWDILKSSYDFILPFFDYKSRKKGLNIKSAQGLKVVQNLQDLDQEAKFVWQLATEKTDGKQTILDALERRLKDFDINLKLSETVGLEKDMERMCYIRSVLDKDGKLIGTEQISTFIVDECIDIHEVNDKSYFLLRLQYKHDLTQEINQIEVLFTDTQMVELKYFRKKVLSKALRFMGNQDDLEKITNEHISHGKNSEVISKLGWSNDIGEDGAWILSNAIVDFKGVNKISDYGIINVNAKNYKLIAFSKEYLIKDFGRNNRNIKAMQSQKKMCMVNEPYNKYTLQSWGNALFDTYGINAPIVMAHGFLASIADFAIEKSGFLETLFYTSSNVSMGKNALSLAVMNLWGKYGVKDNPNFMMKANRNTPAGLGAWLGRANNTMGIIDEYENTNPLAEFFAMFYQRQGSTQSNVSAETVHEQMNILPMILSNHSIDCTNPALRTFFTRCIILHVQPFEKNHEKYSKVLQMSVDGCSYLLPELTRHLPYVKKNYLKTFRFWLDRLYANHPEFLETNAPTRLLDLVAQLLTPISLLQKKIKWDFDLKKVEAVLIEAVSNQLEEYLATDGKNDFFRTLKIMLANPSNFGGLVAEADYKTNVSKKTEKGVNPNLVAFNFDRLVHEYMQYKRNVLKENVSGSTAQIEKDILNSSYTIKIIEGKKNPIARKRTGHVFHQYKKDFMANSQNAKFFEPKYKKESIKKQAVFFDMNTLETDLGISFSLRAFDDKIVNNFLDELGRDNKKQQIGYEAFKELLDLRNKSVDILQTEDRIIKKAIQDFITEYTHSFEVRFENDLITIIPNQNSRQDIDITAV